MGEDRVAITGATGFLGSRLVERLAERATPVTVLTRRPDAARQRFPQDRFPGVAIAPVTPFDPATLAAAIRGARAVVHLAGEPIAARWTPEVRAAIRESRERGTRALVAAIAALPDRPATLVSASACRYYGVSETRRFAEDSPPAAPGDFLADTTHVWEAEARRAEAAGLRVVILRFGIALALTAEGRALITRLRRFLGGRIGSGRQWVSWIHREDAVAILVRALDDPGMAGAYNATAPGPARMLQVTDAFARVSGAMLRVPVPAMVVRQVLGDGATVVLDGQRVHPDRLVAEGFAFRFREIGPAVHDILAGAGAQD